MSFDKFQVPLKIQVAKLAQARAKNYDAAYINM